MAITSSQNIYLAKINQRHVLRVIRDQGPRSRADVVRHTGLSAPTVSKAAASLLKSSLLEEVKGNGVSVGRPAPKLRLATESVQVLGVVIDVNRCSVVASGLDGVLSDRRTRQVETPANYDDLLAAIVRDASALMDAPACGRSAWG